MHDAMSDFGMTYARLSSINIGIATQDANSNLFVTIKSTRFGPTTKCHLCPAALWLNT